MNDNQMPVWQWLEALFYQGDNRFEQMSYEQFLQKFNELPAVKQLQKALDYQFKAPELLFRALTHSSFKRHLPEAWGIRNNERLEFLGDSVLGLIVSKEIWRRCPDAHEGECSLIRGSIVNEDNLYKLGKFYELGNKLLLSKGEIVAGGMRKVSLIADGVEAIIAAIFLDSDFDSTYKICLKWFEHFQSENEEEWFSVERLKNFDPKSQLQEKTMALYKSLPKYISEEVENQQFKVNLYVEDKLIGTEKDSSKKKAQKKLAQKALLQNSYLIPKESENVHGSKPAQ